MNLSQSHNLRWLSLNQLSTPPINSSNQILGKRNQVTTLPINNRHQILGKRNQHLTHRNSSRRTAQHLKVIHGLAILVMIPILMTIPLVASNLLNLVQWKFVAKSIMSSKKMVIVEYINGPRISLNLPSGLLAFQNLLSGPQIFKNLPSGLQAFRNLISGPLISQNLPSGLLVSLNLTKSEITCLECVGLN